jgi:hypothetical protein
VPRVTLKVQLEADTAGGPVALEEAIATEGRRAARELYARVVQEADRELVAASGGTRKRLERRWVATLVGRFRVRRYRVKLGEKTFHPLDRAMGWEHGEASPALRRLVLRIARKLPLGEVAQVVSDRIGEPFSYQSVRRIVRNETGASGSPREGRRGG